MPSNNQFNVHDGTIHAEDGYGYFAINLPHQGQVTVNRTLDFEKTQRYYLTIVASVSKTRRHLCYEFVILLIFSFTLEMGSHDFEKIRNFYQKCIIHNFSFNKKVFSFYVNRIFLKKVMITQLKPISNFTDF